MIRMIAAAAVLCLVIVFVFLSGNHLDAYADDIAETLANARTHAEQEDWDAVSRNLRVMEESWAEILPFARIVLEQCAIRDTEEAMARLSAAAAVRDIAGFLAEAASLESCLTQLARGEDLSWNTVL